MSTLNGNLKNKTKLEFYINLINKSAPYMPRAVLKKENRIISLSILMNGLLNYQPEPLSYNLGESSGTAK